MKIMLAAFNAKYIHSNLAVYDLKAYAQKYASNVILKEYTINQQKDDILRDIYLEQPDVVCVSCYIWNITFVKELMRDLAKILPGVSFWAGGPEVSFDAPQFLEENQEFTGVMVGEGEETFLELAGHYIEQKPEKLKEITGICYRDAEESITMDGDTFWICPRFPLSMKIWRISKTVLFIMRAAEAVLFPAATVFLPLIKSSGSGIRSW